MAQAAMVELRENGTEKVFLIHGDLEQGHLSEFARLMEQELKIKAGETSRDGLFSIEVVACIGACGLAPVISVNGEIHAGLDPMKVRSILAGYKNKEQSGEQA